MMRDTKKDLHLKPLMLIPAAGFGTRVGQPEAKELLPWRDGRPLIELPLKLAFERGWQVHVITRSTKQSLIEYLNGFPNSLSFIHVQCIEPTPDWPDSLLKSEPFWHLRNLVVLPDTTWHPLGAIDHLADRLQVAQVAWAEHQVSELKTWGTLKKRGPHNLSLCEKPLQEGSGWAWGLYGFRREAGHILLEAQSQSSQDHQWQELNLTSACVRLERFEDLTRSL